MKRATLYILPLLFAFSCTPSETTTTEDQATTEESAASSTTTTTPPAVVGNSDTSTMNIVAIIDSRPELSIFRELLHTSYIDGIIGSDKVFTVFAPTNAAFEALPKATLEELRSQSNVAKLRPVIAGHIMPGAHTGASIIETLKTRGGSQMMMGNTEVIFASKDRDLMIGDAVVVEGDIKGTNGIVHIVDKVVNVK
jgi:uncharacterized surface protein with fasciclin (FAS1) repeats